MKKKKEINIVLALVICLLIVGGASYGMNILKNNFEKNNKVAAENLPVLPDTGYLKDNPFYSAK